MEENPFFCERIPIGIRVALKDPAAFNIIKETLTRMGVEGFDKNNGKKSLFQSAHILHKRGQYAIVHFKELFALDGKLPFLEREDIQRRNVITRLLESWDMVEIIDRPLAFFSKKEEPVLLKIVSFPDKNNWNLIQKYTFKESTPRE